MNCGKVTDLMSEYIDDSLSESVRVEFELHVQACEECGRELVVMQGMLSSLRGLSGVKSPVDCWGEVQARISRRESVWTVVLRCVSRPCVAAPALALGMLLAMFLVWPTPMHESNVEQRIEMPRATHGASSGAEYISFIGAHNRVEREQSYVDPDVTFIATEMERVTPR